MFGPAADIAAGRARLPARSGSGQLERPPVGPPPVMAPGTPGIHPTPVESAVDLTPMGAVVDLEARGTGGAMPPRQHTTPRRR